MPTKKELLAQHPEYKIWIPEWELFIRSYFGGKRYRDGGYLFKYPLESQPNFDRRKAQAFFYNNCKPIVDIFVSLLYKREPTRTYGSLANDPLFDSFLADADMEGNTFSQFIREVSRWASAYGRVSVVVDKSIAGVETQAQAIEGDIRPYTSIITPENIIDWSYLRLSNGRVVLDWIKIVESWGGDTRPTIIRIWSRTDWRLFTVDPKKGETANIIPQKVGIHNLGVVPVVTFYNQNSGTRMIGISDIEDISYINRNIYSLCSNAHEIIENTAFPMLAMPDTKGGASEEVETGPTSILPFNPDFAGASPYWMEPPHSSLSAIEVRIERNVKEIYRIANLSGIKTSDSKQPWSGIAMDIENQQRDASLVEKADNMEQAEIQLLSIWALWEEKTFDGSIEYSNDFSLKDLDRDIQNTLDTIQRGGLEGAPTFVKELQKKLNRNLLPKVDAETTEAINDEIDASEIQTGGEDGPAESAE
jgi:hypothetical protein